MRRMLLILTIVAGCGTAPNVASAPTVAPAAPPASPAAAGPPVAPSAAIAPRPSKPVAMQSLASVGLDPAALDRTVDPCDDFYQFACGGWIKNTEISADKPLAMRSFIDIADRNLAYEHTMLEQARTQPGDDPAAKQLGVFYGSCMNERAIEAAGLTALRPLLGAIDSVKDARTLTAAVAALDASGVVALFALAPVQDAADARRVIARIDQSDVSLPDRGYYLNDDDQSKAARAAYLGYAESVLALLGHRGAKREAADVLAFETEIARVSLDGVARRDPRGTYNQIGRAAVARALRRFDWDAYWAAVGLKDVKDVTVTSPQYLAGIDQLLGTTGPEQWRAYLAFRAANSVAALFNKQLEELRFKFVAAMTGQPELSPRWKRCVDHTVDGLGDLVSQMFVRDRFGGASKAAAEEEIRAIVAAMTANLDGLPWMDPQTRAKAKAKLDAMTYQIGYPRKWKTYAFKLDPKAWAANALAARRAERARKLAKIGAPVDVDDWLVDATQVDAYYEAPLNLMVFPAGILQPPFYSVEASIPVNLGGIGMVVGHELTHGFDDQGAQYDAAGNLVNWWQPDTAQRFKQRTQCVIDQYSAYQSSGASLNGAHMVGENIADIGGVKLAFAAYRELRSAAPTSVVADGFTEDQQFFLAFGQAWCAKLRPDFDTLMANTGVHAPPMWRVDGALAATPEFGRAFHCKAGSKMMPVKQCVVW